MSAPKAELAADALYSAITGATGAKEDERLSGAFTNTLFAGLGATAPSVLKRTLKTNPDEDIKILREAGVRLTPAQTVGGRIDKVEEAASRALFGGGDMALSSRRRAFNDFNTAFLNLAGKYIGFKLPNNMKPHARMKAIGEAFDNQYDTIRAQMSVAPDQDLLDDIANLRATINDGSTFSADNASRLNKLLDDQLVRRTANPIGGDEYKSLQSLLKKRKNEFAKNDNLELADGVENMQAILDNAARRRSPPEVVDMLNETDRGFALLAQAQEAARMAGNKPGEFSPAQLLSRQRAADTRNRSRSFVEGDAEGQRFAEAAQNVLGNIYPSSGTAERLAAAGAVGAAANFVSPTSLIPNAMIGIANAPVVRDVLPALFAGRRPAAVEAVGDLMERYKVPLRYAGAQAGRMVSPSEQTPEDYTMTGVDNPIAVSATQGYPTGQPAVADLAAQYGEAPVAAKPAEETIFTVGNVQAKFDPVQNDFYDIKNPNNRAKELADFANPPLGMYHGGHVQAFGNGGQPKSEGYDYGNAARTFGQGLTFGFGDEIEARLRTLASKDPNAYRKEVNRIRMMQERYGEANPKTAMALEGAGMIGSSLLMPELAGARVFANAPRAARFLAGAADDLGQGALYAAGQARTMRDVPRTIREEAPINAAFYGGMSGAGAAGKFAAKKAVGTNRGYQAALMAKRLLGKN
jgi:hypothetical protein